MNHIWATSKCYLHDEKACHRCHPETFVLKKQINKINSKINYENAVRMKNILYYVPMGFGLFSGLLFSKTSSIESHVGIFVIYLCFILPLQGVPIFLVENLYGVDHCIIPHGRHKVCSECYSEAIKRIQLNVPHLYEENLSNLDKFLSFCSFSFILFWSKTWFERVLN